MANRLPGLARVQALIEAFEEVADEEKAERDAVRMLQGSFDLNDFSEQVQLLEKMGPLAETVRNVPGVAGAVPQRAEIDHEELGDIGAMISSMTDDERRHPERFVVTSWERVIERATGKERGIVYDEAYRMSRLRRVAQGSGREICEVLALLSRFATMRQLMIQIGQSSGLSG